MASLEECRRYLAADDSVLMELIRTSRLPPSGKTTFYIVEDTNRPSGGLFAKLLCVSDTPVV